MTISGADPIEGLRREADRKWLVPLVAQPKQIKRDDRPLRKTSPSRSPPILEHRNLGFVAAVDCCVMDRPAYPER